VDIVADFYVVGISPRNPKKLTEKLNPTTIRVIFLLCSLFSSPDSTIWWSFNWITQWCNFLFCVNVV